MIHLSLNHGSRPLCGTRETAMAVTQTPVEELRGSICPDCLDVWDDSTIEYRAEVIRGGYHAWVVVDGLTVATETFSHALDNPYQSALDWLQQMGAE